MIYLGSGIYSNSGPSMFHDGGYTWSKHKYIRKEGNRYIYPEDLKSSDRAVQLAKEARRKNAEKAARAERAKMSEKSWLEEGYDAAMRGLNAAGRKLTQTGTSAKNALNRKLIKSGLKDSELTKDYRRNVVEREMRSDDSNFIPPSEMSGIRASREAWWARHKNARKARANEASKQANAQRDRERAKYEAGQRAREEFKHQRANDAYWTARSQMQDERNKYFAGQRAHENLKHQRAHEASNQANAQRDLESHKYFAGQRAHENLKAREADKAAARSLASKQVLNDKLGKAQAKISATRAYQAASEARAKNRNKDAISGVTSKRSGERAVESAKSARAKNASKAKMKEMEDKALRNWTNNFTTNVTRINEQKKYRVGQKNRAYSENEISRMAADNRATNKRNKEIADYINSNPGKAQGIDDIKVRRKKQKKNYSST